MPTLIKISPEYPHWKAALFYKVTPYTESKFFSPCLLVPGFLLVGLNVQSSVPLSCIKR